MTSDIFISFHLNELLQEKSISRILNNGINYNIKYYDYASTKRYFESPEISFESIVTKIQSNDDDAPVLCKFQDTSFFLYFTSYKNNFIDLSLGCTNYPWKKEFSNGSQTVEFDMQRYLRLMLKLTEGLKINKIEAKIEWD